MQRSVNGVAVCSAYATPATANRLWRHAVRVIAGHYRSRRLASPRGTKTRPTSDRLRETLFNVLALNLPGAVFLDLYAGSGAIGIEAVSRGAAEVRFAETDRDALLALRTNLRTLGITAQVESAGTATLLKRMLAAGEQADIVFMDPPYEAAEEYDRTLRWLGEQGLTLLAARAIIVAEHGSRSAPAPAFGGLQAYRTLKQGDAALTFYRAELASDPVAGE